MLRVIVESPYSGDVDRNIKYAREAIKDCLKRGESPFASHLLYTQDGVLDDNIEKERDLGINAGFEWGKVAEKVVVYCDHGISKGMEYGIENAKKNNISIEYRKLYGNDGEENTVNGNIVRFLLNPTIENLRRGR